MAAPVLSRPRTRDSREREAQLLGTRTLEERLRQTNAAIVCALSQLQDLRDLSTGCHGTRLAEWGARVAVELGLDEENQRNVEVACLLHDVGKIGVPDTILHKPGPLTLAEREIMNRHPEYGWAVLRLFPDLELAGLFALHHHEKFDGSGYPGGLRGEQIPMGARIVAVVDAFDAIVSERCYKRGLPVEEAVRRLRADSGSHFDPDVVRHFLPLALHDLADVTRTAEPDVRP
jgi:HD-GYP domain-containing protein (c-di-GMP phosphodiesterase class II)